jgi:hypothetical protein
VFRCRSTSETTGLFSKLLE